MLKQPRLALLVVEPIVVGCTDVPVRLKLSVTNRWLAVSPVTE